MIDKYKSTNDSPRNYEVGKTLKHLVIGTTLATLVTLSGCKTTGLEVDINGTNIYSPTKQEQENTSERSWCERNEGWCNALKITSGLALGYGLYTTLGSDDESPTTPYTPAPSPTPTPAPTPTPSPTPTQGGQ